MENIDNFLKRINYGYDGLIRAITINSFKRAEIIISTMDADNDYQWLNVKFSLNDIQEFKVMQKRRTTNVVLTYGIRIKRIEQEFFIDFSPYIEADLIDDFRKSDVYFSCKDLKWDLLSYSDK